MGLPLASSEGATGHAVTGAGSGHAKDRAPYTWTTARTMLPSLSRRGAHAFAIAVAVFACADRPITAPAGPTPSPPAPDRPATAPAYTNPVYPGDFADPFVLPSDSGYYAYATNLGSANVPTLRSADLVTWTPLGDALPSLPSWAESGRSLTWAPAVIRMEESFLLLYTARDRRSGLQCIGRAESAWAAGPFVDRGTAPFICQTELGGSIDASVVRDSTGQVYVVWKNDGNCCGKPVTIWSQRLAADGRRLVGPQAALLHREQPWEGPLIEAPTMWEEGGGWHILYSGNMWDTDRYATGRGSCESPLGPCRKLGAEPVMASDGVTAGPGGAEVFTDDEGRRWMVYHGWNASAVGYGRGGVRSLRLGPVPAQPGGADVVPE